MMTSIVEICKVQIVIVTCVDHKEVKLAKINLSSDILWGLPHLLLLSKGHLFAYGRNSRCRVRT